MPASLRASGLHLLPGMQEGPVALGIWSVLAAGWVGNLQWKEVRLSEFVFLTYIISELSFFFFPDDYLCRGALVAYNFDF